MMFLLMKNSKKYQICIPTYIIHDDQLLQFPFVILLIFEICFSIICCFVTIKTVIFFISKKIYHKNMRFLCSFGILLWFLTFLTKYLMMPFVIGKLTIGESKNLIKQWYTENEDRMIKVDGIDGASLFFLAAGLLQWHYIASVSFFLLTLCIERSLATYFIRDYEQKSRKSIIVFLIIFHQFFSFFLAVSLFFSLFPILIAFAICLLPNCVAVFMICNISKYNKFILKQFDKLSFQSKHTLNARYQANENLRSIKIFTNVFITIFIMILIGAALIALLIFDFSKSQFRLINFLFNAFLHLNPLIICPAAVFGMNGGCLTLFKNYVEHYAETSSASSSQPASCVSSKKSIEVSYESDLYFKQLQIAWK